MTVYESWNPERRRDLRLRTGVLIASYEAIALAVDRPDRVPRLTDIGHRYPPLGWGMAAWTVGHLCKPTLLPLLERLRRVRP